MSDNNYTPNQIPLASRLMRAAGAIVLIVHGVIGILRDDVIIPTKRSALHLHGISGWVMTAAMICAAAVLLSVVVDHFDKRDNEAAYKRFGKWMSRLGWLLMGLAMALHLAGFNFPAPSEVTKVKLVGAAFVLLCTLALAFANEKAVERSAHPPAPSEPQSRNGTVPVPGSTPANTAPLPASPPVRLDRSFLGLLLMVSGALVFLSVTPGLVNFLIIQYTIAAGAIVAIILGWLIFSGRKRASDKVDLGGKARKRKWMMIRIGILLIIGLAAIWYMKAQQWGRWRAVDEAERLTASAWNYGLEEFGADITADDLKRVLEAEGYRVRCYGDLGPNERMSPDDTVACWTIANNIYDMTSHMISFTFGPKGLHTMRLDFPGDQWKRFEKWFRQQGESTPGGFGRDQMGSKVLGRRSASGLLMTSEPAFMGPIMLVYQPYERVLSTTCLGVDERDPQWRVVCGMWPKPSYPSQFAARARPSVSPALNAPSDPPAVAASQGMQ